MNINDLQTSVLARVTAIREEGGLRQHFLDMGLTPGTVIRLVKRAPMGDPLEVEIRGYSLTLRKDEAALIGISPLSADSFAAQQDVISGENGRSDYLHEHNSHPGFGEPGKYHSDEDTSPLPKGTGLRFAVTGQYNSGKTTIFNALTGANSHVGNFPGVTVECREVPVKGLPDITVTDLPGIYSLSASETERNAARDFLLKEKPHCIIDVVDVNNLERNLYLTVQLMELGVPIVLALNMMDELRGNGGSIRVNEMEQILGIPVIPVSGTKGEGIEELIQHAEHIARYQEAPKRRDFCDKNDYGGAVHRCLHGIMHLIEDHAAAAGLSARFAAGKIVEGDAEVTEILKLDANEKEMIEHIICQMEQERGLDRSAAMADMRYSFIEKLCHQAVIRPKKSREYLRSAKIDRILTGKWTAIPVFIAVMAAVIWLSIDAIGAPLQNLLARGIDELAGLTDSILKGYEVSPTVRSLVMDAIFKGVGSIVSFVPVIIVLFFFLSLLEDSGYMARVAFVTDKFLRRIGLSGRCIVPLLIGLGCSVPAVMAARTLPSSRDRRITILLTPFMSCSAKIPVYAFISSSFFPGHGGLVLICLYLLGIVTGITVSLVRKLMHRGYAASPFIMELPTYRLPHLKNVFHLLSDKTMDFLRMAFTVIFLATIVIWFMQSFDWSLNLAGESDSILAGIAGWIAPLFRPIGLDDWRIITALISGFLAKESIVATMGVLGAVSVLTVRSAISLLVFCLLYTPCVAAIASIRRELGRKWALSVVVFQCVIAWIVAFLAYSIVPVFL